jgi:hypothetical protein
MQNLRTIGQGVFVRWVPENGMFPKEGKVVLNIVHSASALACDTVDMTSLRVRRRADDFVFMGQVPAYLLASKFCGINFVTFELNYSIVLT